MKEEKIPQLRELIENFLEQQTPPEEEFGVLFNNLSIIYLNAENLVEGQIDALISILIGSSPNMDINSLETIESIAIELECSPHTETYYIPDIEYVLEESGVKNFLSKNKHGYLFKQCKKKVEIRDIVSGRLLVEGGVKLLFKRW